MPGLENGSSFENAFTWDHTQYPGGTRVFGATTNYGGGGNTQDWWALYLLANKTYIFQTRDPTAWDTYLYLYSPQGYYVAADYDSGDDGHGLSKITYLTPERGLVSAHGLGLLLLRPVRTLCPRTRPGPEVLQELPLHPEPFRRAGGARDRRALALRGDPRAHPGPASLAP